MKEWILKTLFLALTSLALSSCGSDSTVSIDSEGALSSASLSLISGDGQFAAINTDYSDPLVVKVTGADDVSNIPIIFEITSGSGSLSQSTVNTDSDGQASVNIRSGSKAETIKVFAKMVLAGKSESLTFSLVVNGTSADWEITQVGGSSSVTAGSTFQIRLRALNTNGELDTDFNGAKDLAFTTDNGSAPNGTVASLPANGSYNFTNGVIDTDLDVVFYNSSESAAEKFSIQVSGSSLTAATMTAIEVTDAAPSTVKIVDTTDCSSASEIGDETYVVPTTQTLYSLYYDTYENCIEGIDADSNWTKAFLDSQVTYDTAISGVNTVDFTPVQGDISEATGFSITDTTYAYTDSTGTITLTSGAASQFLITGLDSSGNYTVDAGDTVEILVEARDVFGNLAEDYTGSKTLNFSTTATTTSPPTGTASAHSADIPANGGTYVFANGVLTSGDVDLTFYNSGDTPTVTVTDANDTTINGTSPSITVDTVAHTYTRVRSASNNGGSLTSGGTIDADDSLTFYCATYDTYGNYLTDDATADWTYSGDITAGELGGLTDSSSLSYDPSTIGNGSVTCTVGSISDNSGTYTINPGEPTTVAIADSGTTSFGSVFSETAGVNFAVALRVYDSDGNFADNFTDDIDLTLSYIGSVNVDSTIPSEITPSISTTLINSTASISEDLTVSFSSGDATVSNLRLLNEANTTDRVKVQLDDNDSTYSIATAQSGYVTVTTGSLAYISIRNAASNGGDMVNAPALDNDGNITLYAAGFDAAG
ncbi:MAG: beta strand repeat-containing protein, partial [Bacteriovoracaceae bacterium]